MSTRKATIFVYFEVYTDGKGPTYDYTHESRNVFGCQTGHTLSLVNPVNPVQENPAPPSAFSYDAEGGVEVCLDLCSGVVSVEGTFTYSLYANFGNKHFNRSYEWGGSYTTRHGNLFAIPSFAIMKDYCNKQPKPDSCCCSKK